MNLMRIAPDIMAIVKKFYIHWRPMMKEISTSLQMYMLSHPRMTIAPAVSENFLLPENYFGIMIICAHQEIHLYSLMHASPQSEMYTLQVRASIIIQMAPNRHQVVRP